MTVPGTLMSSAGCKPAHSEAIDEVHVDIRRPRCASRRASCGRRERLDHRLDARVDDDAACTGADIPGRTNERIGMVGLQPNHVILVTAGQCDGRADRLAVQLVHEAARKRKGQHGLDEYRLRGVTESGRPLVPRSRALHTNGLLVRLRAATLTTKHSVLSSVAARAADSNHDLVVVKRIHGAKERSERGDGADACIVVV